MWTSCISKSLVLEDVSMNTGQVSSPADTNCCTTVVWWMLYNAGRYSTHAAGPGRGRIACCFLFVEGVSVVQAPSVTLRLAVLVGEAPHCLHAGEGLSGHLIGLSQWLLNLCGNSLKDKVLKYTQKSKTDKNYLRKKSHLLIELVIYIDAQGNVVVTVGNIFDRI